MYAPEWAHQALLRQRPMPAKNDVVWCEPRGFRVENASDDPGAGDGIEQVALSLDGLKHDGILRPEGMARTRYHGDVLPRDTAIDLRVRTGGLDHDNLGLHSAFTDIKIFRAHPNDDITSGGSAAYGRGKHTTRRNLHPAPGACAHQFASQEIHG